MIKILLIEDIEHYLQIQRGALTRSNFEVLVAQTAPEAIRAARRERPQAVVLDLEMAERAGGNVVTLIRTEPTLQNVPVLLVSSRHEAESVAREQGFAGVLRKPVDPAALLGAISRVLNLGRRVEVRTLVVASVLGGKGSDRRVGRSVDLSDKGLLAEFSRPLPVGTAVELRFYLPGQNEGITVRAEVARCASGGEEVHDVGFRFSDLQPADGERLKAFLAVTAESPPALLKALRK